MVLLHVQRTEIFGGDGETWLPAYSHVSGCRSLARNKDGCIYLFFHPSIYLSIYLSVFIFIYLSIRMGLFTRVCASLDLYQF